jgi:hypothetical protein
LSAELPTSGVFLFILTQYLVHCRHIKKRIKKLDNYFFLSIIITILTITISNDVSSEDAMVARKSIKKYKTNEICSRFDISRATLFRWESEGLLPGVDRDWRGWRVYNDANLRAIEKIMKGKSAG